MNKEQWGHGFNTGFTIAEKQKTQSGLTGKFFHSFDNDGFIKWQGRILSSQPDDYFLIQLFSWLDGYPTEQKLVPFKDMVLWIYYSDAEEWKDRAIEETERRKKDCVSRQLQGMIKLMLFGYLVK